MSRDDLIDPAGRTRHAGRCAGDTPARQQRPQDRSIRSGSTTVRAHIGYPLFRPLARIRSEELKDALEDVLQIFSAGNIHVDFAEDISWPDRYRFLTELLPEQALPAADDRTCTHYWLYRESPPSDVTEAIFSAEHFLEGLFQRTMRLLLPWLGGFDRGTDDATRRRGMALKERCEHFMEGTFQVISWRMTDIQCSIDRDRAIVRSRVEWTGWDGRARTRLSHAGPCVMHLVRCTYGGWDVIEMECPGVR